MSQKSAAEREARIASLTSKLTEVSETLAILTDRLETNQAQKATLDAQIQTLQGKLDNFSENPDDVIERLRAEFVDLVNQEAQLSNAITKNTSELDNIRANAASKSDENQALSEKYDSLKVELEATTQRSETLKLELDQLLSQYSTADTQFKKLEADISQTQNRLFSAMDELNKGKARLTSLENIRASHANFYQGVKAVLQTSDKLPGIIGAVADLVSFDKQYATAMDIALAGGAQNIIVSDEQSAKSAINFLRAQRLGRATFLPLTTIKPRHFSKTNQVANIPGFIDTAQNLVSYDENIAPAISNLLGSVLIVDN